MTVVQLIAKCNALMRACQLTGNTDTTQYEIAKAVVDLLAEADPCGWEPPTVSAGVVLTPSGWGAAPLSPDEARAHARMLLIAADEAEVLHAQT